MTAKGMTIKRFEAIIASYGADPSRWPGDERDRALELLKDNAEAAGIFGEASKLDAALADTPAPKPADAAYLKRLATIPFGAAALGTEVPTTFGEFIHELFPRRRLVPQVGLAAAAILGIWLGVTAGMTGKESIFEIDPGHYLYDEAGIDQDLQDLR